MLESVVMRTDHFCRSLCWTFRKCSTAVITSSSLSDWTPPGSSQAWCWGWVWRWVLDRFRCTPGWQPSPLWARGLMEDALLPSSPTTNRLDLFCLTVLSVEGPCGRATLFQLVVFWTRSRETPALCQSKFINLSGSCSGPGGRGSICSPLFSKGAVLPPPHRVIKPSGLRESPCPFSQTVLTCNFQSPAAQDGTEWAPQQRSSW